MASDSFVGELLTLSPYKEVLAERDRWYALAGKLEAEARQLDHKCDALLEQIEDLEWQNKGIDEWRECALQAISKANELHADLGDSQFWVDRRVACISGGYPPSEAKYVSLQEYVLAVELERDKAFETWRKFHVATLNAFIENEHQPLQRQNEMLRAQVQAYREDLEREVTAHGVTIQTLHERDKRVDAEHLLAEANAGWSDHYREKAVREEALALKYRDDANRNENMLKRSEAENCGLRTTVEALRRLARTVYSDAYIDEVIDDSRP